MLGYLAPAATRLLQAAQHVYQVSSRNFTTTLSLPDKGAPVSGNPPFDGTSARYLDEMYNAWLKDPKSVHAVRYLTFVNGFQRITNFIFNSTSLFYLLHLFI